MYVGIYLGGRVSICRYELQERKELEDPHDIENRGAHVWEYGLSQEVPSRYVPHVAVDLQEFTRAALSHLSRRIIGARRIGRPGR